LVHSLFVGFARVFSVTASEPLFLVQWGADKLPYLYIGSALGTAVAGALYARLAARLPFVMALVVNLGILLTLTAAFRLLLTLGGSRGIVLALAIWSFVLGVLLNLEFWSLAGHLLDVRQAKRLFGLIGSGEVVATIAGGLVTPFLVGAIGTTNLLVVAAGAIAGALGCLIAVSRTSPEQVAGQSPPPEEQPRTSTPGLLRQPYVVLMFMYTSVSWLVFYLIDNAFYQQAAARYTDDARLASFLGVFLAGAGLLTLVARTLVSGRIITHFGLTAGLLALPVLDAIGAGTLAVVGMVAGTGALVFALATMTKLIDKVIGNSIYQTSFLTLYQPLPGPLRIRAQTVTESFVEPAAAACAGLVLLILLDRLSFGAVELSSVAFAILLGLIVVARRLGREYPAALMRALSRRGLDAASLTLDDPASVNVLLAAVRSPGVGAVLYALDLLESIDHVALPSALSDALAHPVPEVRQDVLGRIERLRLVALLPAVRERLRVDPVVAVRGACLRTLATLLPGAEAALIAAHLDDVEPEVRVGAVVGLVRRHDLAGGTRAREVLAALATSTKPEERALAARTIGTISRPELAGMLHELLGDGALMVRNASLIAAGTLRQPELWPRLIGALARPTTAAAAMGLVAGGDAALPTLRALFDDPASPRSLLVHLARVCGRIGTDSAQQLLVSQLHVPNGEVRKEVLAALRHCGWRARDEAREQVLTRINAEMADAARLAAMLDDTRAVSAAALLLRDAIRHQLQQTGERLLLLLSLIYDPETIRRVRMHLRTSSPEKRAYATELLDVTIEPAWRARILAVFEDVPDEERARRLGAWFPQPRLGLTERLQQLAATDDGDQYP
ncbi:MAG TPA: HEAT repeat domain-containing protein, partial [Herpetosiphonaceae bacterium]|nr:HEAT repeat domain-containing protein [Herpetosiphonaceae bacterium]